MEAELIELRKQTRRAQLTSYGACIMLAFIAVAGFTRSQARYEDEIRTKRLVVLDDKGRARVIIGQDAESGRISRSAGLLIFDSTGTERGGFGTMDNGRVVLAWMRRMASVRQCETASA